MTLPPFQITEEAWRELCGLLRDHERFRDEAATERDQLLIRVALQDDRIAELQQRVRALTSVVELAANLEELKEEERRRRVAASDK